MNDLLLLEQDEGVTIILKNGKDYVSRGKIANTCADGLAAHEMYSPVRIDIFHRKMCESDET